MLKLILLGVTSLGLGGGYAYNRLHADHQCPLSACAASDVEMISAPSDAAAEPTTNPTTNPTTEPAEAVNKFCPVTKDEEVDQAVTLMHDGKKIGFCCKSCIATFKADPEKYLKDMK